MQSKRLLCIHLKDYAKYLPSNGKKHPKIFVKSKHSLDLQTYNLSQKENRLVLFL